MRIQRGLYRKRCKRYDIPWGVHSLCFKCFHDQPFFQGTQSPGWFLTALERARGIHGFQLWAFVIMPDHVHLVIGTHEGNRISRILYDLKKPVTTWAIAFCHRQAPGFLVRMADREPDGKVVHRFWQRGGGYDRNLQSVPDIHEKIRYTHLNPVRRALVELPEQWQWSSWRAWNEGIDHPIRIDRETLPPLVC